MQLNPEVTPSRDHHLIYDSAEAPQSRVQTANFDINPVYLRFQAAAIGVFGVQGLLLVKPPGNFVT